jgi:serine/threonine protein kinase
MIKAIAPRREPVIVDFGLAHRDDPDEVRVTRSGQVLGTLGYMAPEQVRGALNEIGPACDIYALGVMLYELLTGRLPFSGLGLVVAAQILPQEPLPPSEHRPDLDPRLEAICLKAMAKQVGDRYASMGDLAAVLTDFLRTAPATATSTPGAPTPLTTDDAPLKPWSNRLVRSSDRPPRRSVGRAPSSGRRPRG